jgi:hypothetical protein
MSPRNGPHDVGKRKFLTPPGLELQPLCSPTRSQSLLSTTLSRLFHQPVQWDIQILQGIDVTTCVGVLKCGTYYHSCHMRPWISVRLAGVRVVWWKLTSWIVMSQSPQLLFFWQDSNGKVSSQGLKQEIDRRLERNVFFFLLLSVTTVRFLLKVFGLWPFFLLYQSVWPIWSWREHLAIRRGRRFTASTSCYQVFLLLFFFLSYILIFVSSD